MWLQHFSTEIIFKTTFYDFSWAAPPCSTLVYIVLELQGKSDRKQ
jgi:hypothetical protein